MTAPFWDALRRTTQSRIGLGRVGNALPTSAVLELSAAHSTARDAVHEPLDVDDLTTQLDDAGFSAPVRITSSAADRAEYLRRPDLGRSPAELPHLAPAELVVVLADGLSARAVQAHAVPLLIELQSLRPIDTVVIATQARVALGDHVGVAAGARAVLVLIGERPGLSVNDSLGVYLTWAPRPGRSDAERNCVSNVHPPDGLGYAAAARGIAALLVAAAELGESGVRLKDRSRAIAAQSTNSTEPIRLAGEKPH